MLLVEVQSTQIKSDVGGAVGRLLGAKPRRVAGGAVEHKPRLLGVAILPAHIAPCGWPGSLGRVGLLDATGGGDSTSKSSAACPARLLTAQPWLRRSPKPHAQRGHVCLLDVVALGAQLPVLGVHPVLLHLRCVCGE